MGDGHRVISKSERAIFYGLLALILVAPLVITSAVGIEIAKWFFIRTAGPVLCAIWIVLRVRAGRPAIRHDALTLLAFAFVGSRLISLTGATNLWDGLTEVSKQIGLLSVFLLVANVPGSEGDRRRVLWVVALVGAATSAYGVAQHWGYDFFPWEEELEVPVARGVSFFGHATFAGSALIMIIPLTVALASTARNLLGRAITGALVLLMLYHLSFSGARIATVALFAATMAAIGLRVFDVLRDRKARGAASPLPRRRIAAAGIAILVVLGVGSVFAQRAWNVKGGEGFVLAQVSLAQRFYAWDTASRMFLSHPLRGVGAGNYGAVSPEYWNAVEKSRFARHKRRFFQAHNEYLEVAAEQGLPGIGVMLGLTAFALTTGSGLARRSTSVNGRRIGIAFFAAVVASSIDVTMTFAYQSPGTALLYWTLLGLMSSWFAAENAVADQSG